ncbi:MAG: LysR family transcriptional regulator [Bdellovibrionota bacterium]
MEYLHWELSVLHRAVAFQNLTGAASHVGISQPQLSRIIRRLEADLGLSLLERDVKRKSRWSASALRLAEIYERTFHAFQTETARLVSGLSLREFRFGTLEGLIPVATALLEKAMRGTSVRTVFLDVEDLDDLESIYLRGGFDAILTIREPARRKSDRVNVIGTQRLEAQVLNSKNPDTRIWSTFEWGTRLPQTKAEKSKSRRLDVISNSLALRRHWAESLGGEVILPGPLRMAESKVSVAAGETRVILVGQSTLPAEFWTRF